MNIKLIVNGTLRENFGNIPWLRTTKTIHETVDLSSIQDKEVIPLGPLLVGASIEDVDPGTPQEEIDLLLAVSLMGMQLYQGKYSIAKHISQGPMPLNIGHGQLTFIGTVQIVNSAPVPIP